MCQISNPISSVIRWLHISQFQNWFCTYREGPSKHLARVLLQLCVQQEEEGWRRPKARAASSPAAASQAPAGPMLPHCCAMSLCYWGVDTEWSLQKSKYQRQRLKLGDLPDQCPMLNMSKAMAASSSVLQPPVPPCRRNAQFHVKIQISIDPNFLLWSKSNSLVYAYKTRHIR